MCFLVGALPPYADAVGAVTVGVTFFVGSLLFTAAAFVQLALSGRRPPRAGTHPADRWDWWGAAVQLVGTVCFNVSTAAALVAAVAEPTLTGAGWRPDAYGSVAFLVSSALAIVATRDRGHLWDTDARTWHGTWLNVLGSVAFAASAVGAYVDPSTGDYVSTWWDDAGTIVGAVCFLVAALLSRRSVDGNSPSDALPAE
nr:YrhK family protein [Cellulosimicrobium arenosum]